MLDRLKAIKALEMITDELFMDLSEEKSRLLEILKSISKDEVLKSKIEENSSKLALPTWYGKDPSFLISVKHSINEYCIVGVDGSQIYSDRHQGISCYLVNIGIIQLNYLSVFSNISIDSEPYIFIPKQEDESCVNLKREELELQTGFEFSNQIGKKYNSKHLCLFDGSIIFWYLEGKDLKVKDDFLSKYLKILENFYKNDLLVASYISLPRSRELIDLICSVISNFDPNEFKRIQSDISCTD